VGSISPSCTTWRHQFTQVDLASKYVSQTSWTTAVSHDVMQLFVLMMWSRPLAVQVKLTISWRCLHSSTDFKFFF
jgi:hypothetical protein